MPDCFCMIPFYKSVNNRNLITLSKDCVTLYILKALKFVVQKYLFKKSFLTSIK